jgi:hypothetical protein
MRTYKDLRYYTNLVIAKNDILSLLKTLDKISLEYSTKYIGTPTLRMEELKNLLFIIDGEINNIEDDSTFE